MSTLTSDTNRVYTPLPINGDNGFPQTFAIVFRGVTYRFRFYVNASPALISDVSAIFDLPVPDMFLVARVDQDLADGSSKLVFLRKIVPELVYASGQIALSFPVQRVAVRNLNGQGAHGSRVTGGIAPRWA